MTVFLRCQEWNCFREWVQRVTWTLCPFWTFFRKVAIFRVCSPWNNGFPQQNVQMLPLERVGLSTECNEKVISCLQSCEMLQRFCLKWLQISSESWYRAYKVVEVAVFSWKWLQFPAKVLDSGKRGRSWAQCLLETWCLFKALLQMWQLHLATFVNFDGSLAKRCNYSWMSYSFAMWNALGVNLGRFWMLYLWSCWCLFMPLW